LLRQVMTGGMLSIKVTKLVQMDLLPQQSTACQMAAMVSTQVPLLLFVTADTSEMNTFVPQQASNAVGGMKLHAEPHGTVWFAPQVMTGGTLSITVTVWLQLVALPQQSVICQLRVTMSGQVLRPLVTVLMTVMLGGLVQQSSTAIGGLKFQVVPHWTILFVGQITFGGAVSTICST
jgi:hypothetical protein